jgi:hypothetical protein
MTWIEDFTDLLCDLDEVQRRWRKVLADVPLGDRAVLEEAWRLVGRDGKAADPGASFAATTSVIPEIRQAAEVARRQLRQTLGAVHGALHRLDRPVVLPLDFARLIQVYRNGVIFTLGEASTLAPGHPILEAAPTEALFIQDGKRFFVLGKSVEPPDGGRYPGDFYELAAVIKLTNEWAAQQRASLLAHSAAAAASIAAIEARKLSR